MSVARPVVLDETAPPWCRKGEEKGGSSFPAMWTCTRMRTCAPRVSRAIARGRRSRPGRVSAHGKEEKSSSWSVLSPRTKGLAMLNVVTMLFASNMALVKTVEGDQVGPVEFGIVRFAFASLVFLPFLRKQDVEEMGVKRPAIELGTLAFLGYGMQAVGLLTADASRCSFISAITVIAVPIVAGLSGQKIKPINWIAAGIALAGVSLLESGGNPSIGDFWALGSSIMFATHIVRTEKYSKRLPSTASVPLLALQLLTITALATLSAGLLYGNQLLPFLDPAQWQEGQAIEYLSRFPWGFALYSGIVTTGICLRVELEVLKNVTSVEAALVYCLEPVYGAAIAFVVLGDRWGALGWVGALMILSSSVLTQVLG